MSGWPHQTAASRQTPAGQFSTQPPPCRMLEGIVWEPGEVHHGKFVMTPHEEGKEDEA